MSFLAGFETAGRDEGNAAFAEAVRYREKRLPSVWATEVRKIPAGTSPLASGRTIPYEHDVMPHCVEQMDSADDPQVNKIVIWEGIRDGKTNGTCLSIIGRTVTDDPGNIYSVHPTADDVHRFSVGDIEPMIDACLGGYFVEKKSRDSGRTVTFKKFRGGWLRIVSAGSITKFRGASVKVLLLHELDALDPDAIYKAFGRTAGFSDAVIVLESTGTLAPTFDKDGKIIYNSRIHEAYDQGDKRKWFGPCRKCDALQWIRYEQFSWPKGRMAKVVMLCRECDAAHDEKQWRQFQRDACWFPTAGLTEEQERDIAQHWRKAQPIDPTVRSYWRNGFNSLLPTAKGYATKLHQFVAEGEAAKTSVQRLRVWKNEIAAELWDPTTEGEAPPPWKPIFDRREDYGVIVPAPGLYLTAFADVQLNRLEVGWRAWGRNEQSWGMDHVVIDGHVRDKSTWDALRIELARKWEHESGAEIRLGMAFIDGGKFAEDVYLFFQELARNPVPGLNGHVRASKGIGKNGHPIVTRNMMTVAKNLKGHHIGTWEAKDRIYERLRMEPLPEDPREGQLHFNRRYGEEYFQQLTVEQVTITIEKGEEIRKYVNPKQQRNEALDIEVGNLAAFRLRPMTQNRFAAIETELQEQVKAKQQPSRPAPQPSRQREESSWMAGVTGGGGWSV